MSKVLISRRSQGQGPGQQVTSKAMGCGGRTSGIHGLSRSKKAAQRQGKSAAGDPLMMRVRAMISAATAVAARIVTNQ